MCFIYKVMQMDFKCDKNKAVRKWKQYNSIHINYALIFDFLISASQFYVRRKPVASTINTLAGALYRVFCKVQVHFIYLLLPMFGHFIY